MRISVSEWAALKLAVRLPRALFDPQLIGPALRERLRSRRGVAIAGLSALALLLLLHVAASGTGVRQLTDAAAALASVRAIDARWDAAVVQARSGQPLGATTQATDMTRVARALGTAEDGVSTDTQRTSIAALRKALVEKAELVGRFERAAADSRYALSAIMRADAAVNVAIREAWSSFPQRERLVAAENLTVRVIAESQQYQYAPTVTHRANLQAYTSELARAQSLPKPLQAGLERLEADAHQLLLLKPLEHMLGERLRALGTGARLDTLSAGVATALAEAVSRRNVYSWLLLGYTLALVGVGAYLVVQAIARFRDLEALCEDQARALEEGDPENLETRGRVTELRRVDSSAVDDEAEVISEHRRSRGAS